MAVTLATVQVFRSNTAGLRPSSLLAGQVFVNQNDGVLCWPDSSGIVRSTWLDNAQGAPKTISTAAYTVLVTDQFLVVNSGASCVLTLPTPSASLTGKQITVKNIVNFAVNASVSVVKPISSGTAGVAILAATAGKWATMVCDGTFWVIMSSN